MDQEIDVIDPSGQLGSVPKSQLAQALSLGYTQANQADISNFQNQKTYGDQTFKAFLEGVGRGATFGASTYLEKALGVDPEAIKQRQIYNPGASFAGELTGAIGSVVAAPAIAPVGIVGEGAAAAASKLLPGAAKIIANPESATIAQKIIAHGSTAGLGSAIEGAAFGAGQTVHESALGDLDSPDGSVSYQRVGENLLHNVGYGALIGGGIGAGIGAGVGAYKGFKGKPVGPEAKAQAAKEEIADQTNALISQEPVPVGGEIPGAMPETPAVPVEAPKDIQGLQELVKKGEMMGFETNLSQKPLLQDAVKLTPDTEFPVLPMQMESLTSPKHFNEYRAIKETAEGIGADIQNYEYFQKQEAVAKIKNEVSKLAPGKQLTSDVYEAGDRLTQALRESDKAEREAMKPLWEKFDQSAANQIADRAPIMEKIGADVKGASELVELTPEGYKIGKYKPSSTISKTGYKALKDVVDTLNEETVTISGLRNLRNTINDALEGKISTKERIELSSMKKNLMDVIQDNVQKFEPDLEVREMFKRWAINEERRAAIESILKGDLATGEGAVLEGVIGKLFSNSAAVKDAKALLGDKFNEALGNYMMNKIASVSDPAKNFFSSNKFRTFLSKDKNRAILREAFADNPAVLDRINAWNNKMVVLPDAPMLNNSGTAKTATLLERIKNLGTYLSPTGALQIPTDIAKGIGKQFQKAAETKDLNKLISGEKTLEQRAGKIQAMANMERMAAYAKDKIGSLAKKVFKPIEKNKEAISGTLGKQLTPKPEEKKKQKQKVKDLSANLNEFMADPNKLVDAVHNATESLYGIAPGVTNSLQTSLVAATQFLASKVPQVQSTSPLSGEMEPSDTEIASFNRYYEVVQKPMVAMEQLAQGTLNKETIETLETVYPKLYTDMRTAVMTELTDYMAKPNKPMLPYKKKMALSMFLGQDLMDSLNQQSIAQNQMILSGNGAQQAQNQQQQAVKTSQQGLSNLSMAQNAMTPMQKSAMRVS